jgi:MFS family permease
LFNPRKIGVIGGLLSSIGLFASAFVYDIRLYFLTYGVLFAIGQSFLLASTFAILPHYFNKKLALVNGLMNGLAAILVVVFPILTSISLKAYGLAETFYFLGAASWSR